jgi:hypothetical protein
VNAHQKTSKTETGEENGEQKATTTKIESMFARIEAMETTMKLRLMCE